MCHTYARKHTYIFSYKNIKISITFRMIISEAYRIRIELDEKDILIARLLCVFAHMCMRTCVPR